MLLEVAAGSWHGEAVFRLQAGHAATPPPPPPSPHVFAPAPLALKQLPPVQEWPSSCHFSLAEAIFFLFSALRKDHR